MTNHNVPLTPAEAAEMLAPLRQPPPVATIERYMQAVMTRTNGDEATANDHGKWSEGIQTAPRYLPTVLQVMTASVMAGQMDPSGLLQAGLLTGLAVGYLAGRDEAQREQLEQLMNKVA